jgi:hypothetical protein
MGRSSATRSRYSRPSLRVEFQIPGTEPPQKIACQPHTSGAVSARGGSTLWDPATVRWDPAVPVKIRRGLCLTKGWPAIRKPESLAHQHFRPLTHEDLSHEHLPAKSRAVALTQLPAATPLAQPGSAASARQPWAANSIRQLNRRLAAHGEEAMETLETQPGCRGRRSQRPPNCPPKLAETLSFWSGVLRRPIIWPIQTYVLPAHFR